MQIPILYAIQMNSIWFELNTADRRKVMHDLAQRLESAESDVRLTAARILLYILQVTFTSMPQTQPCTCSLTHIGCICGLR